MNSSPVEIRYEPPPAGKRVWYFLADPGVPLLESRKGSSIHARSMIHALEAEGCDVTVFTLRKGKGSERAGRIVEVSHSWISAWWKRRFPDRPRSGAAASNRADAVYWLLRNFDFHREVSRRARASRPPDLVYARHSWLSWSYARLRFALGCPMHLEVNALLTPERAERGQLAFERLSTRIESDSLRAADELLPVSFALRDQIMAAADVPPDRIRVTPNAVDRTLFNPANRATRPGSFVIAAVNSFRAYHGNETLLRAAAILREEMPDLRLLLIGGGELFDQTAELARELGLGEVTEFTGVVSHAEVARRLAEADVCVSPNEGEANRYNCPMKLFEYMSAGVPVIASRWGEIPAIMQDGKFALLHEPGDPEDLARAIRGIRSEPEEALRRVKAGLEFTALHTWRSVARCILGRETWYAETAPNSFTPHPDHRIRGAEVPPGIELRVLPPGCVPTAASASAPVDLVPDEANPGLFRPPGPVPDRWTAEDAETDPNSAADMPGAGWARRAVFRALLSAAYARYGRHDARIGLRDTTERGPLRVLRIVSKLTQGGVAKVCVQSVLPLSADQAKITLLVFDEKNARLPAVESAEHIRLVEKRLRIWPGSYDYRFFRSLRRLARIIREADPDVIHVHEPQFAPAVRIAAGMAASPPAPVAVHLHNDYTQRRASIDDAMLALHLDALRRSRIIACSATIERAAREWIPDPLHPITRIEDGTDDIGATGNPGDGAASESEDHLIRNLRLAARDRPVIAMMAHIIPHKRIGDFLLACRTLLDEGEQVFVLVMGYGKARREARLRRRFCEMFGPNEGEFLYQVRNPRALLSLVSVGVSTSSLEGLGLNILEFQREGIPVVCTDLEPHREMVTDGETGLLVPVGDSGATARAIRRLLSDAALRQKIAEAGKRSAMARSWSRSARETMEFYRSVLGS